MRYIRPNSLSWWSGVALIAAGAFATYVGHDGKEAIMLGLGIIGLRDKLERIGFDLGRR